MDVIKLRGGPKKLNNTLINAPLDAMDRVVVVSMVVQGYLYRVIYELNLDRDEAFYLETNKEGKLLDHG